ncbi:MAG: hypothetical protein LH605_09310 [Microbacteriaceae bacterium]|nr:hypothetical protein [Microbacteriaceae bacterium]
MSSSHGSRPLARRAFDWMFRSRVDGRVVLGQAPNLAILSFTGALILAFVLPPRAAVVVGMIAYGSLAWWAYDELFFGVNPFRRMLGAAAVVGLAATPVAAIRA